MKFLLFFIAVIPNRIIVDGVLHRNQFAAYYKDTSAIYTSTQSAPAAHLSLDSLFVAKDTVNIYIRIFTHDTLWLGEYGDLFIAIDTQNLSGGNYSPLAKHVTFRGNLPDYILYVNDNNDCVMYGWDGNRWYDTGTPVLCSGAGNHPDFEVSFPIDSVKSSSYINLTAYTTYKKKGDSIADYSVQDTAYPEIIVDGVKEPEYMFVGASDQSGGDGANLDSLFVTWDSLNLYIFITTQNTASWDVAYGIALDVDQFAGSGYYTGESDAWGRKIDFGNTNSKEPYAPDYEVYFWWSGADASIGSSNFCKWTGANFECLPDYSPFFAYQGGSTGLSTIEIRIPWDSIGGVHSEILLSAWVAGGNNSSAVDVIPHDDQISNNANEWIDVDTIFTYVVITPDKPVIQDAISTVSRGNGASSDTISAEKNISLFSSLISFGYYDYSNWGDTAVGFLYPVDGVVDTGGFYEDEMLCATDSKNAWLTWDSDSIYIGYTYQAFDAGYGGDGDLFVYFQVDSVSSPVAYSDSGLHYAIDWWSADSIVLPLNMDYALAIEDGNYYALYKATSDNGWQVIAQNTDNNFPGAAFIGYDNTSPENGVTEVSIALSALSNPSYLGVVFFAHTDETGVLYGISPADSLPLRKTVNNNDGVNDTIYHFWGIYRVGASGVYVNSVKDYYLPTSISEHYIHSEPTFHVKNGYLYFNLRTQDVLFVYSVTGRLVKKAEIGPGSGKLSLVTLPSGVYFARTAHYDKKVKFLILKP